MTPKVKQRIELIKAGQVPDGYKRTKAGIVPAEWEEKRIGDVLTQRKTLMCISEDAPLLSFTIEKGVIDPEDKKSNKREFLIKDMSTKKFALTEVGDIIYNPANLKFGAIHRNNLKRGVVSPIYGIFYGEQNSEFMGYLLHNQRFIDYAKIYTEGTVEKLKTLKADTFLKLRITLPPIEEQEKIVEILSTQDKIIDLQQKKIDELKKLKNVFLQKMFLQKGKDVPAWRFLQFTDIWKQCKLSDEFDKFIVPIRDKPKKFGGSIPWTRIEDIEGKYLNDSLSGRYVTEETVKNMNLKIIPKNSLIVSSSATFGVVAVITRDLITNQTFIGLVPNDKETIDYWYAFFHSNEARKYMKLESAGSTIFYIARASFENMPVKVPSKDEMIRMGSYFNNMDDLITLHQRKLDEMREYKRSLMQLLLTGIVRVNI